MRLQSSQCQPARSVLRKLITVRTMMGRKGASVGHGYNDKEGENCFAHRQSFERAVDRLITEPWFGAFFSIARLSLSAQAALRTVANRCDKPSRYLLRGETCRPCPLLNSDYSVPHETRSLHGGKQFDGKHEVLRITELS